MVDVFRAPFYVPKPGEDTFWTGRAIAPSTVLLAALAASVPFSNKFPVESFYEAPEWVGRPTTITLQNRNFIPLGPNKFPNVYVELPEWQGKPRAIPSL